MSLLYRGVEQLVARQAHNLEVACSSPASATKNGEASWTSTSFTIILFLISQAQISSQAHLQYATHLMPILQKQGYNCFYLAICHILFNFAI